MDGPDWFLHYLSSADTRAPVHQLSTVVCKSGRRINLGSSTKKHLPSTNVTMQVGIRLACYIAACCCWSSVRFANGTSELQELLFSRFRKSSGRWALVSFVLLVISCFFFFGFGFEEMPWTSDLALLCAVLVAGFIPFFCRSRSISIISRGSSIPRNSCLRSSSTLRGTLGSFG